VFSVDETGLFWKKMLRRMYITKDEIALPGHKPMKDRLTLLLGSNASGDFLSYSPSLCIILTIQGSSSNRNSSEVNWWSFGSQTIKHGLLGSFFMNGHLKFFAPL
jgi:hypothetical protein